MINLGDAKSINVFKEGAWQKERNAYVYSNGKWLSLIEYVMWIYEEGTEHIPLTHVFEWNDGKFYKTDKFLHFNYGGGTAVLSTTDRIDVSDFEYISIEWKQSFEHTSIASIIMLSEKQDGSHQEYIAAEEIKSNFDRRISKLDISAVEGEFYIRVAGVAGTKSRVADLKVYKIWLE